MEERLSAPQNTTSWKSNAFWLDLVAETAEPL